MISLHKLEQCRLGFGHAMISLQKLEPRRSRFGHAISSLQKLRRFGFGHSSMISLQRLEECILGFGHVVISVHRAEECRLGFGHGMMSLQRLEENRVNVSGSHIAKIAKRERDRHSCGVSEDGGIGWSLKSWNYPRRLWTSTPLQMGRRSSKIATKKGAQDKKKAKLYGRIGKQIVAAVKDSGPNPVSNPSLATILQTAKDYNVPKEILDRNIKKASDKNQQDFEELTYEVYGFGGVGMVLEVLTDNNNRAAANIRGVVKKSGGKIAEKGSVLFNFKRTGVIYVVKSTSVTADAVLLAAMDAGAEDVVEPEEDEDEEEEEEDGKFYKVLTAVDQFFAVLQRLREAGIPVDTDCSGLELFPVATVKPDDEAEEMNRALMDALLELDDVDAVSSTQA